MLPLPAGLSAATAARPHLCRRPSAPHCLIRATSSAPCAGAAMARARRRSRTPAGRTERRSRRGHHPARPGRSAPTPHATRGGQGTAPSKRLLSRYRKKGSTGVQGESVSFEKGNTLTAAGADVRAQAQGKTALFPQCAGSVTSDQGAEFSPLTPCPTPGRRPAARAGQQPQAEENSKYK